MDPEEFALKFLFRWNHTPADEARMNGHHSIANLIESWIAANPQKPSQENFSPNTNDSSNSGLN